MVEANSGVSVVLSKKTRLSKIEWYFKIAKDISLRSPCLSDTRRGFGAILVKDDMIISTGYAGAVRGAQNCGIDNQCLKDLYNEAPHLSYDHCCSIHAEMNAIINAGRAGVSTIGATLFLAEGQDRCNQPCFLCRRFIIQAGIKDVYYYTTEIRIPTPHGIGLGCEPEKIFTLHHEEVTDYVKLENDWIQEQLKGTVRLK